jgi:hypothetical protein
MIPVGSRRMPNSELPTRILDLPYMRLSFFACGLNAYWYIWIQAYPFNGMDNKSNHKVLSSVTDKSHKTEEY